MSDKTKSEESGSRLDLGLSSFVGGISGGVKSPELNDLASILKNSVAQNGGSAKPEAGTEDGAAAGGPESNSSEYSQIAERKDWSALSLMCEKRLTESNGADLEAKLWWIRSQFSSGAVPAGILAASLDSVSGRIFESADSGAEKKLTALCAALLKEFSAVLKKVGEAELASVFEERAGTPGHAPKPPVQASLAEAAQSGAQVSAPPLSGDEKLAKIKEELFPGLKNRPSAQAEPRERDRAERDRVKSHSAGQSAESPPPPGKAKQIFAAFTALLIVLAGFYGVYRLALLFLFGPAVKHLELAAAVDVIIPEKTPLMQQPAVDRLYGFSQLDAVYYDLSGKDSAKAAARAAAEAAVVPAAAAQPARQPDPLPVSARPAVQDPPAPVLSSSSSGSAVQPQLPPVSSGAAAGGREVVNTTSPVERIDRRPPREDYRREYQPPSYDERNDREREMPEIDFPPYRSNRRDSGAGSGPADRGGREARSSEYMVIARTKIMEEPSYWAYSLGDLYEGDKVVVIGHVGKWLRISTKRGRTAYILAQDAERY